MKNKISVLAAIGLASFAIGAFSEAWLRKLTYDTAAKPPTTATTIATPQPLDLDQPIRRIPGVRPAAAPHTNVICQLMAYRVGKDASYDSAHFATLLSSEGQDFRRSITGFRFIVLEPERFRGQILTMAYDGVLASGDPLFQFYFGHRYVMRVSESRIGLDDYADLF